MDRNVHRYSPALAWFDLAVSTVHVFMCVYVQDECDIELEYIVWLDAIAPIVTDATTAEKTGNADDDDDDDDDDDEGEGEEQGEQQQDSDEEEAEL